MQGFSILNVPQGDSRLEASVIWQNFDPSALQNMRLSFLQPAEGRMMQDTQGDYYYNLVLFIFASQLYFYVLVLRSLLGY